MKINNIQAGKVNQYYKQMQQNKKAANKNGRDDSTEISTQAKEIMTARAELNKMPQIRENKVSALKAEIENGNYQVDSKAVAAKILNNVEQV